MRHNYGPGAQSSHSYRESADSHIAIFPAVPGRCAEEFVHAENLSISTIAIAGDSLKVNEPILDSVSLMSDIESESSVCDSVFDALPSTESESSSLGLGDMSDDDVPELVSISDSSDSECVTDSGDESSDVAQSDVTREEDRRIQVIIDSLRRQLLHYQHPHSNDRSPHTMAGGGKCSILANTSIIDVSDFEDDEGKDSILPANTSKSIIEVSDSEDNEESSRSFIDHEWIGRNRKWDADMPRHVYNARNSARDIPSVVISTLILDSQLSVAEVLQNSDDVVATYEAAAFSNNIPNCLTNESSTLEFQRDLRQRRPILLAALKQVSALRQQFNDAWISGAHSIQLPGDALSRYPLWVEHFLGDFDIAVKKERSWRRTSDWISTMSTNPADDITDDLANECVAALQLIPWNSTVPGFGPAVHFTTRDLAKFLSDDWLNDDMINAGNEFISQHLGQSNRARIINVLLFDSLRNLRSAKSTYKPGRSPLDELIQGGHLDTLYIPVHVNGNHWTLMRIDLEERQYAYGDSLSPSASPPREVLKTIFWWLDAILPSQQQLPFTISQRRLIIPQQADGFSCGIIILSTAAHILLDFEPWSQATYSRQRMEWFLRLSHRFIVEDVST